MSTLVVPQREIMSEARNTLSNKWGLAIGTLVIYWLVSIGASIVPLGSILLGGPLALGWSMFSLKLARHQDAQTNNIFDGFQNFGTALGAYLLMSFGIVFAMILLIVPGIILGLGWSQTMYLIADDPEISPTDALGKSWEMMKGHKMDLFVLGLRFIPWAILSVLTLGIGFLWLIPYAQVTFANFYNELIGYHDEEDDDYIADSIIDHIVE